MRMHAVSPLRRINTKTGRQQLFVSIATLMLLAHPSQAAEQNQSGIIGMKHLMVTPDIIKPEPEPEPKPEPAPKPVVKKEPKILTAEESLVPLDKLENWDKLSLAAYAHKKKDLDALLKNIDLDKDIIPPQGFFLSAKALSDAGRMEDAALYFIIGQLRMEFDMARWPSRPDTAYETRQKNNRNKSDDQKQPMGNKPRPINQHAFVMDLSSGIGRPVFDWLASHPKQFKETLDRARQWDLETRYAYHPGYDLTDPIPFKDWPKALETTRKNFFDRMTKIQQALAGYVGE